MVWPFSKPSEDSSQTSPGRSSERKLLKEEQKQEPKQQPLLLEDTEPRFNNGPTPTTLPIKEAVSSISTESFKFASLVKMPCFREAGLTGLSTLGVLSTIIFITQKSPRKAVNWGIGGLLLGSTISWEQCRSRRRKELEFTAKAKETVANKEKPMLNKQNEKLNEKDVEHRKEAKSWWSRG